jgi:diacylglycerol kinase family enzyme
VNPRAGAGGPSVDELVTATKEIGVSVYVLREGEDLAELARAADADVLGMAGGDGSLGAVAQVAIERDLPFVCLPWGTRNHFAADAGLPVDDALGAIAAFGGAERRVDVGRIGERIFLNNVSLGIYARLVHRRERRRRRNDDFARLRALATSLWHDRRWTRRFRVDGQPIHASVVLVANNKYLAELTSLGERERLDGGVLALYAARGFRRLQWTERTAERFRIETGRAMHAAVDGEPTVLASPLELRVDPGALRLLVPPESSESDAPARSELEGEDEEGTQ